MKRAVGMRMVKQISLKNKIRIINVNQSCEPSGFWISKITAFLKVNGYELVFDQSSCDIVLIYNCCVTSAMRDNAQAFIEESLQERSIKKVIIFGCIVDPDKNKKINQRIVTIDLKEIGKLDQLFAHTISIEDISAGSLDQHLFTPFHSTITLQDYFVLICQGCTQSCSYCNIKKVKGGVVSRSIADIINDIQQALREGKKDVVLVGDDCGSYGADIKTDLVVLIKAIIDQCPEVRLKINYLFPGHLIRLFPTLKEVIATGKVIYMNVPLQSGSERILELMNRKYDMERIKEIIREIKILAPSFWINTHIIFNFPTETREDFLSSLRVVSLFDDFAIFNYSDSPLTPASKIFPKVERQEGEKRLQICREMIKRVNHGQVRS